MKHPYKKPVTSKPDASGYADHDNYWRAWEATLVDTPSWAKEFVKVDDTLKFTRSSKRREPTVFNFLDDLCHMILKA